MPVSTYCDIKRQNMESRPRLSARRLRAAWTVKPLPVPLALVHPPLFPWESASYYRNSQTLIAEFCKKKLLKDGRAIYAICLDSGWEHSRQAGTKPLFKNNCYILIS